LQNAYRKNLLRFAHHVINHTRFTTREAQDMIRPLVEQFITPTGGRMGVKMGLGRGHVRLIESALRKAGMPVRHLSEAAATKPMVEGFESVTTTGARKAMEIPEEFKVRQRDLAEERDLVLEKLSPDAVKAYENVMLWKREMTERLLSHGLLTDEWITNFERKFGIPHLRHIKTDEGLVRRFQRAVSMAITKQAGTLKSRKIEGALKDITDRVGHEIFETDIAKIMFASEVEVTSAIENWKLLNKVASNMEWTAKAVPVERKVKIARGKHKGEFRTVTDFKAEEGYDLIKHPMFEGKMVRSEIADDIKKMVEKSREDLGAQIIKKFYDPMHKWLRAWTLFAFPSYHIRNTVGAVWNNFLADVSPADHIKAAKVIFGGKDISKWADEFQRGMPFEIDGIRAPTPNKKLPFKVDGKSMTHQQLLDEANEFGVMGKGQFGPHGEIERGMVGEMGSVFPEATLRGAAKQLGTENILVKFGARVGTQIENTVRLAHYMNKRKLGLSAMDASMSVKKYQFDYQELSDFERNWLKRAFFFYTWTRKNVPLQAQMFLQRPGKFTGLVKAKKEVETQVGGPEPDTRLVPEWLKKQFGVRFRWNPEKKTYEYFLVGSWLPAADIERIFDPGDELMQMLSPLLKVPIEQATNKSLFFDQPLEEIPGDRKEFLSPEAGQMLSGVPGASAIAKLLFGAPLEEGIMARGRVAPIDEPSSLLMANSIMRQFRPVNEARRISEAAARGGPELALMNLLVGKSYEFNPDRARRGKDYQIKMQIGYLKSQLKKAQRRGKPSEIRRLMREINALQEELIR
jgi:hypothetical protein